MEELDGDEVRLSANGVSAARDIVQVSFCCFIRIRVTSALGKLKCKWA